MSERKKQTEWFENWFDSKYYHILYKNRDDKEAKAFIDALVAELKLSGEAKVLDLACGAGRHSIYLNQLGYDVIGMDLSEENIKEAKKSQNDTLSFFVHDMRELYWENHFDCILNLFTSFGYFESDEDHEKTIMSVASSLKYGGRFVLDFMNSAKIVKNLILEEKKSIEGVNFHITRKVIENRIIKRIEIIDGDYRKTFEEKVRAFGVDDLMDMLDKAGLLVDKLFGDYKLSTFDESTSDRLIILASK